jgi:two-component sensor histidine kinase
MSTRFGNQFGTKVSISDLEKQVEQTSTEISDIRHHFEKRLTSIQMSVEQLATTVDTQYTEINSTVQSLVDTFAKQNYIIAGIQQEFKISMEALSKNLISPSYHHPTSSTSTPGRPSAFK